MFNPRHWAAAFVNSLENQGADAEEGISVFSELVSWTGKLPGGVFGSSAAAKLEKLVRQAAGAVSPALEVGIRFLALMVRKNVVRHAGRIIDEARQYLDRKNGVIRVTAEYAFPPGDDAEWLAEKHRIEEAIIKRTGARKIEINRQINAELIGGCRLRMGDEIIDASVRSRLRKLETFLAGGDGGN